MSMLQAQRRWLVYKCVTGLACGQLFFTAGSLKRHQTRHHRHPSKWKSTFCCSICNKEFEVLSALESHAVQHYNAGEIGKVLQLGPRSSTSELESRGDANVQAKKTNRINKTVEKKPVFVQSPVKSAESSVETVQETPKCVQRITKSVQRAAKSVQSPAKSVQHSAAKTLISKTGENLTRFMQSNTKSASLCVESQSAQNVSCGSALKNVFKNQVCKPQPKKSSNSLVHRSEDKIQMQKSTIGTAFQVSQTVKGGNDSSTKPLPQQKNSGGASAAVFLQSLANAASRARKDTKKPPKMSNLIVPASKLVKTSKSRVPVSNRKKYKPGVVRAFTGKIVASSVIEVSSVKELKSADHNKIFICQICGQVFVSVTGIRKHLMEHPKCLRCTKCFSHEEELAEHLRGQSTCDPEECDATETLMKQDEASDNDSETVSSKPTPNSDCLNSGKKGLGLPMLNAGSADVSVQTLSSFQSASDQHERVSDQEKSSPILKTCPVCSATFVSNALLLKHTLSHKPTQFLQCTLCEELFTSRGSFTEHLSHCKPKGREYTCNIYNKSFPSLKSKLNHERAYHSSTSSSSTSGAGLGDHDKFTCPECEQVFDNQTVYVKHLLIHVVQRNCGDLTSLQCQVCQLPFSTSQALEKHLKTHKAEVSNAPVPCPHCSQTFDSKKALVSHQKKHFYCQVCDLSFLSRTYLDIHNRLSHQAERPWTCDLCDASYKSKFDLIRHELKHQGKKFYVCGTCGQDFYASVDLKQHEAAVHSSSPRSKPYMCGQCGKKFFTRGHLNTHRRSHSTVQPFQCPHCSVRCKTSKNLQIHIRHHTGKMPIKCKVCGEGFMDYCYLGRHMMRHKPAPDLQCRICSKAFYHHQNLKQHMVGSHFLCFDCEGQFKDKKEVKLHQRECSSAGAALYLKRSGMAKDNSVVVEPVNVGGNLVGNRSIDGCSKFADSLTTGVTEVDTESRTCEAEEKLEMVSFGHFDKDTNTIILYEDQLKKAQDAIKKSSRVLEITIPHTDSQGVTRLVIEDDAHSQNITMTHAAPPTQESNSLAQTLKIIPSQKNERTVTVDSMAGRRDTHMQIQTTTPTKESSLRLKTIPTQCTPLTQDCPTVHEDTPKTETVLKLRNADTQDDDPMQKTALTQDDILAQNNVFIGKNASTQVNTLPQDIALTQNNTFTQDKCRFHNSSRQENIFMRNSKATDVSPPTEDENSASTTEDAYSKIRAVADQTQKDSAADVPLFTSGISTKNSPFSFTGGDGCRNLYSPVEDAAETLTESCDTCSSEDNTAMQDRNSADFGTTRETEQFLLPVSAQPATVIEEKLKTIAKGRRRKIPPKKSAVRKCAVIPHPVSETQTGVLQDAASDQELTPQAKFSRKPSTARVSTDTHTSIGADTTEDVSDITSSDNALASHETISATSATPIGCVSLREGYEKTDQKGTSATPIHCVSLREGCEKTDQKAELKDLRVVLTNVLQTLQDKVTNTPRVPLQKIHSSISTVPTNSLESHDIKNVDTRETPTVAGSEGGQSQNAAVCTSPNKNLSLSKSNDRSGLKETKESNEDKFTETVQQSSCGQTDPVSEPSVVAGQTYFKCCQCVKQFSSRFAALKHICPEPVPTKTGESGYIPVKTESSAAFSVPPTVTCPFGAAQDNSDQGLTVKKAGLGMLVEKNTTSGRSLSGQPAEKSITGLERKRRSVSPGLVKQTHKNEPTPRGSESSTVTSANSCVTTSAWSAGKYHIVGTVAPAQPTSQMPEQTYLCWYCYASFSSMEEMREHSETHMPKQETADKTALPNSMAWGKLTEPVTASLSASNKNRLGIPVSDTVSSVSRKPESETVTPVSHKIQSFSTESKPVSVTNILQSLRIKSEEIIPASDTVKSVNRVFEPLFLDSVTSANSKSGSAIAVPSSEAIGAAASGSKAETVSSCNLVTTVNSSSLQPSSVLISIPTGNAAKTKSKTLTMVIPAKQKVRKGRAAAVPGSVKAARHRSVKTTVPGSVKGARRGSLKTAVPGSAKAARHGSVKTTVPGSVKAARHGSVKTAVPGSVKTAVPDKAAVPGSVKAVPGSVKVAVPGSVKIAVPGSVKAVPGSVKIAVPGSVKIAVPGSVKAVPGSVEVAVPGSVKIAVPGSVKAVPGSVKIAVPGSVKAVPGSVKAAVPNSVEAAVLGSAEAAVVESVAGTTTTLHSSSKQTCLEIASDSVPKCHPQIPDQEESVSKEAPTMKLPEGVVVKQVLTGQSAAPVASVVNDKAVSVEHLNGQSLSLSAKTEQQPHAATTRTGFQRNTCDQEFPKLAVPSAHTSLHCHKRKIAPKVVCSQSNQKASWTQLQKAMPQNLPISKSADLQQNLTAVSAQFTDSASQSEKAGRLDTESCPKKATTNTNTQHDMLAVTKQLKVKVANQSQKKTPRQHSFYFRSPLHHHEYASVSSMDRPSLRTNKNKRRTTGLPKQKTEKSNNTAKRKRPVVSSTKGGDASQVPGVKRLCTRMSTSKDKEKDMPFQCDVCSASFTSRVQLQQHLWSTHRRTELYLCSHCISVFSSIPSLTAHFQKHAQLMAGDLPSPAGSNPGVSTLPSCSSSGRSKRGVSKSATCTVSASSPVKMAPASPRRRAGVTVTSSHRSTGSGGLTLESLAEAAVALAESEKRDADRVKIDSARKVLDSYLLSPLSFRSSGQAPSRRASHSVPKSTCFVRPSEGKSAPGVGSSQSVSTPDSQCLNQKDDVEFRQSNVLSLTDRGSNTDKLPSVCPADSSTKWEACYMMNGQSYKIAVSVPVTQDSGPQHSQDAERLTPPTAAHTSFHEMRASSSSMTNSANSDLKEQQQKERSRNERNAAEASGKQELESKCSAQQQGEQSLQSSSRTGQSELKHKHVKCQTGRKQTASVKSAGALKAAGKDKPNIIAGNRKDHSLGKLPCSPRSRSAGQKRILPEKSPDKSISSPKKQKLGRVRKQIFTTYL